MFEPFASGIRAQSCDVAVNVTGGPHPPPLTRLINTASDQLVGGCVGVLGDTLDSKSGNILPPHPQTGQKIVMRTVCLCVCVRHVLIPSKCRE